jgi:hypothetical protein
VSNRSTFGALFGRDLCGAGEREAHKRMLTEAVLSTLAARDGIGARGIDVRAA